MPSGQEEISFAILVSQAASCFKAPNRKYRTIAQIFFFSVRDRRFFKLIGTSIKNDPVVIV